MVGRLAPPPFHTWYSMVCHHTMPSSETLRKMCSVPSLSAPLLPQDRARKPDAPNDHLNHTLNLKLNLRPQADSKCPRLRAGAPPHPCTGRHLSLQVNRRTSAPANAPPHQRRSASSESGREQRAHAAHRRRRSKAAHHPLNPKPCELTLHASTCHISTPNTVSPRLRGSMHVPIAFRKERAGVVPGTASSAAARPRGFRTESPKFGVPYWGPYDKGILVFGDLYWGSTKP